MSTISPTTPQIVAQVKHLRIRLPEEKIFGLRSPQRYSGQAHVEEGNEAIDIIQCDSPLAMRLALRETLPPNTTRVLITPLDETDLADDIRLRLPKRRLYDIDAWDVVRQLFQAREVDPELRRHPWLADKLLSSKPALGYQPAMAGYLSPETVWPQLLGECWGLKDARADLPSLLQWSLNPEVHVRIKQSEPAFLAAAIDWLVETAGTTARPLIELLGRVNGINGISMGLVLGLLHHPEAIGRLERAMGRLEERYFGGKLPKVESINKWAAASVEAVSALRQQDNKRPARMVMERADSLILELEADSLAHLSEATPLGLTRRLERLGRELTDRVRQGRWQDHPSLEPVVALVREHRLFAEEPQRADRLTMALRLTRWLSDGHTRPVQDWRSLGEAASYHQREGGRVDWARRILRSGDPVKELAEAYSLISEAVTQRQENQSRSFARLLVDWTAADNLSSDLLSVEQVLDQVVVPLAAQQRVLVLVIDGMSAAVYQELLADLTRKDWEALCPVGRTSVLPCLAVIPSETEYSRTSLLTGKLKQGTADTQKEGFQTHPGLVAASQGSSPPVLFFKASLHGAEGQGIDPVVRQAIENPRQKVVGLVLNAVDDHLFKGGQLNVQWNRDQILGLEILLSLAQSTSRMVVLCSDHGHIMENQSEGRDGDGGGRWRTVTSAPLHDEMLIKGRRVLVPGGQLIAPVTEKVRFGAKGNGYHGGLTPQEMVAPVAVLSCQEKTPNGWDAAPTDIPAWWDDPFGPQVEETTIISTRSDPDEPVGLFNPVINKMVARSEVTLPWVTKLLDSDLYKQQLQLLRRNPPSADQVSKVLTALDERGGRMTQVALARAISFSETRIPGLIANLQRLLNVDGYMVIEREDSSNTIDLKRELLLRQFGLE